MKSIKKVELIFENTEVIEIEAKYFMNLDIEDITSSIHRYALNSISRETAAKHVSFILLRQGNKEYKQFGQEGDSFKETVFKRILHGNDITSVTVIYEDDTSDDILVDWNEEDEYMNTYQKTELTETGDLLVVINKDKKLQDCFDEDTMKTLNDEALMELYHGDWFTNL